MSFYQNPIVDDITAKMNTNTTITDSKGQSIQIKVPQPEYITETFNMHSNLYRIR